MKWGSLLVAAWTGLFTYSVIQSALPAAWWFDAGAIHIEDSRPGVCPVLSFDREINRPFHGRWTVTVMRRQNDGSFATYRTFSGENDYRPDNALPVDLDLCWWVGDSLGLPPGEYRVHTLWIISPRMGPERQVRRASNIFNIRAIGEK